MVASGVRVGANVLLRLYGPNRVLKEVRYVHNIVPTVGLAHIADQLSTTPGEDSMGYMAVGEGSTTPASGQTSLISEVDRIALDSSIDSSGVVTYTATFGPGEGTGALQEAGIFNSDTAGTMLVRAVYDIINKMSVDTLIVIWTLTFSDDGI